MYQNGFPGGLWWVGMMLVTKSVGVDVATRDIDSPGLLDLVNCDLLDLVGRDLRFSVQDEFCKPWDGFKAWGMPRFVFTMFDQRWIW